MALRFNQHFPARPGVIEPVAPLVRRLLCDNPGPFTFTGTCTYVVGEGEVAVIDPGPDEPRHFEALRSALAGERVSHILVTHSHRDHSPLARRLARATGAPILGFPLARSSGADGLDGSLDSAYGPDRVLAHGDMIEGAGWRLEVLHTPGHLPNHGCFALVGESVLFSGDHVMGWSTSVVAPPHGDMTAYLASLGLLLGRRDLRYLPAHGPPIEEPQAFVAELIAHRQGRERAILRALEKGPLSLEALVSTVYPGLAEALRPAAAQSASAHLAKLAAEGRLADPEYAGTSALYRLAASS